MTKKLTIYLIRDEVDKQANYYTRADMVERYVNRCILDGWIVSEGCLKAARKYILELRSGNFGNEKKRPIY